MRRALRSLIPAVALFLMSAVANAALSRSDGDNRAQFTAGPAGLSLVGKTSNAVTVDEGDGQVRVHVALAGLDTGISLRNRHMREKYLEVGKFPEAVLSVPRTSLTLPAAGQKASGDVDGKMSIHGRTVPVRFHYDLANDGGTYKVTGRAPLDVRDFGIEIPSYFGVTVDPHIVVDVVFAAHDG